MAYSSVLLPADRVAGNDGMTCDDRFPEEAAAAAVCVADAASVFADR